MVKKIYNLKGLNNTGGSWSCTWCFQDKGGGFLNGYPVVGNGEVNICKGCYDIDFSKIADLYPNNPNQIIMLTCVKCKLLFAPPRWKFGPANILWDSSYCSPCNYEFNEVEIDFDKLKLDIKLKKII